MSPEERIAERMRATKRERMARKDVEKEGIKPPKVEYGEIKLPNKVISKTTINGTVETTKQPKSREEAMVSPEEWMGENGREIVKVLENVPIGKMINANRRITEIHTEVSPKKCYYRVVFGVISAIVGVVMFFVTNDLIYFIITIGGFGISVIEWLDFKEAEDIEKKFKYREKI